MKTLLIVLAVLAALALPTAVPKPSPHNIQHNASSLLGNPGENLFMQAMTSMLSEENKAAFSSMLYTYDVDCEPTDATIALKANDIAAATNAEVMKDANKLMDFSIRNMGREKWCAYFKTTIDDIKSHATQPYAQEKKP